MGALALQPLKAKDVFLAQEVLPADRRRKLVSIAQGLGAIRAKLKAMAQTLPLVDQDHLARAPLLESQGGRAAQLTNGNLAGCCAEREADLAKGAVTHAERREARPQQQGALDVTTTTLAAPAQEAIASRRMTESDGLAAAQPSKHAVMSQLKALASTRQMSPGSGMFPDRGDASRLIEAARPFIVMMVEELAKAFVKVLSDQGPTRTMPAAIHRGHSLGAICSEEAPSLHASGDEQVNVYPDKTGEERSSAGERDMECGRVDGGSQEEGGWQDEFDVQPLFDPKLPPSANSDFKPSIGLVGTPGTDFEELRQRYPQLQLTIVQANALSDVRRFGHCQRIIALRDAISPDTDDLLHRLLRHRYVRLDGDISEVEGQFNAWLAHPDRSVRRPGATCCLTKWEEMARERRSARIGFRIGLVRQDESSHHGNGKDGGRGAGRSCRVVDPGTGGTIGFRMR